MMMITRLIVRLNWFYKTILKQEDPFWIYYYPVAIYSMILSAYVWGIMNLTTYFDLRNNLVPFCAVAFIILGMIFFYYSSKRQQLEIFINKEQVNLSKLDVIDFLVVLFIIGGILTWLTSLVILKTST